MKLLKALSLILASSLAACSSEPTVDTLTRDVGVCGTVETHVVGVFEATDGEGTIILLRPGQHALVLSAHEATTWHVQLGPDAELVHVYAVGYHPQTVIAPPGTDVVTESFDEDGVMACGYEWSGTSGGCDTRQLLQLASKRVHHEATSYHGCYQAANWTIGRDLAVTSDCDLAGFEQSDKIISCGTHTDGTCGGGSGSGSGSGSGGDNGSGSGIIIP